MSNFKLVLVSYLQEKLNLQISKGVDTFAAALTHKSYKNTNPEAIDYEKLETLGDAFISLIVTKNLYQQVKEVKDICCIRREIVSGSSLSWLAKHLELQKLIRVGKGCQITDSILEDVYEALIGACYLELGYETAKQLINKTLYKSYLDGSLVFSVDYKTPLQEWVQANLPKKRITYILDNHIKLSSNKESFTVSVCYEDKVLGQGKGFRRKDAEQASAKEALIKLKVLKSN